MLTPWGDSRRLRELKLPPGQGTPRELVVRSQRRRLFAATVAAVAEKGYDETSVADLIELSGVSRASFYRLFEDKRACFEAMVTEVLAIAVAALRKRCDQFQGEAKARVGVEELIDMVVVQPAAARVCLVESYAAGDGARTAVEAAAGALEELVAETFAAEGAAEMPAGIVSGVVGGFYKVLHTRLHRDVEGELPDLAPALLEWMTGYRPPPQPLRPTRARRPAAGGHPPFPGRDRGERILRALAAEVAENGYAGAKVSDVAARAGVSLSTFYRHFEGKHDALLAALDSSGAQMLAATMPAARRVSSWPQAVRVALESMCGFLAAEPEFAALRSVEVYAAGPEAIELRDRLGEELYAALFALPFDDLPEPEPLVLEAIAGATYGLLYRQVRAAGAETVPAIAPLLTYISLAPFVGPDRASMVANDDRLR